jgi:hypothetical protein
MNALGTSGIAVTRNDASRDELQALKAAGVIGVAFNAAFLGVDYYKDIGPLLERLRELDMIANMQVEGAQLRSFRPVGNGTNRPCGGQTVKPRKKLGRPFSARRHEAVRAGADRGLRRVRWCGRPTGRFFARLRARTTDHCSAGSRHSFRTRHRATR